MNWKDTGKWIISLIGKQPDFTYLRKFPILKDLTNRELHLFSQLLQERSYHEGEYVYREDYPLAVIFLVLKGLIEVHERVSDTVTPILMHKYQFLGVVDMYNENKRKGSAKAVKDSVLLALSRTSFQEFLLANPRTGVKILNNICQALSHYIYEMDQPIGVVE